VRIPVEEGFKGYFRGIGPSIMRAAANNGGGIAAYDHTKQVRRKEEACDGRREGGYCIASYDHTTTQVVLGVTGQSDGLAAQARRRVMNG